MKKTLVFVAAFALVLVAGAALAFMGAPAGEEASHSEAIEEPTTTSTSEKKVEPEANETSGDEKPLGDDHESKQAEEEPVEKESTTTSVTEPKDTTPPKLEILFPENGQHFETKEVVFEGITEPTAQVFAGDYRAEVDDEGNWRIVLLLTHDGVNVATFKAVDPAGNEAIAKVEAHYDAPEKQEPKETSNESFSAHQKYGSCGEDIAYDEWSGTGAPGTKIWIGNKHGFATTTVGDHGEWYLKVKFPEMPCGTHEVVLETDTGIRKVYQFTRLCEAGEGHGDK